MSLDELRPGAVLEASELVDETRVASHIGSGSMQVYATPAMVTFVEHTCRQMIEPYLPPGQTSVGIALSIKHLAPTAMGVTVSIKAEVTSIEGQLVRFRAEISDPLERIGEAEHTRAIIDVERFLRRVDQKSGSSGTQSS